MQADILATTGLVALAARKARTAKRLIAQEIYRELARSELTWRYLANFGPWLKYQCLKTCVDGSHELLSRELKEKGIVITSVAEVIADTRFFQELEAAVWQKETEMADEIQKARQEVNEDNRRVKPYLITLLGSRPNLDPNNIFARLAVRPEVLAVVNGYFAMLTRLRHYNVWHNIAMRGAPRESQLWHRDPEDRCVLKMFVYLTDVDEGAGPLTYAPGTHAQGPIRANPESTLFVEGNSKVYRSDDSQMNTVVPKENWITATGTKGTVVFADTRGYHKGGLVRNNDRIVYICEFTSKGSILLDDLFGERIRPSTPLDAAASFAISI
jgi:hypothetical protein